MASAIRTIRHEDRLSLVEHLAELRTRLIVSALALAVAFGICMWQNNALLSVVNAPLAKQTSKQVAKGNGTLGQTALADQAILALAGIQRTLAGVLSSPDSGLKPAAASRVAAVQAEITAATARIPRKPVADKPVTLGIGEPFTSTITVAFYFALLISLPVILFQAYGFVLPAFSPTERKVALPLMLAIPFLFLIGVTFGYFIVFPASVRFFQNFNSSSYNVLVQASAYYRFEALILLAMGLIFQVPVGILAATRAGIVTPKQLRKNRRYAVVVAAVIAALLPGDAITMALETLPLVLLYEISIHLATFIDKRAARRAAGVASAGGAPPPRGPAGPGGGSPPTPGGGSPPRPDVGPAPTAGPGGASGAGPTVAVPASAPPPVDAPTVAVPRVRAVTGDRPTAPVPAVTPPRAASPRTRASGTGRTGRLPAEPAAPPLAPPPIPPTAPPPRPTEEEDDDAL